MMICRTFFALVSATTLTSCARPAPSVPARPVSAEVLRTAVHDLTDVIVYDIFSPPQASRVYAYASVAAYETLRQGDSSYRTLAGQLNGLKPVPRPVRAAEVSLPLAAVHAFMTVGRAMTFSQARMDTLRKRADESFRRGTPADVFKTSIAYGDTVAAHILAWASTDGYKESRGMPRYTVTSDPGRWSPTPPAYMDAVEPHWGSLRPFTMDSGSQFRPAPAFPYSGAKGSPFFRDAEEVFFTRRKLSEEQRAIAAFWDCNPYVMHVQGHTMFATKKITPGGHWMGIVGLVTRNLNADLVKTSAAYATTAIALADGFISAWDEKYHSNLVRPETVINRLIDDKWEPLLQTPPFPEYPSAHSVISAAAAAVLTSEFGSSVAFTDSVEMSYGLPPRRFSSFDEAAAEAAISRMYGGIHYRRAVEEGRSQGMRVGANVVARVRLRGAAAVAASSAPHVAGVAVGGRALQE